MSEPTESVVDDAKAEPDRRQPHFGERWDAPIVDHTVQVPTPVGEECIHCTIEVAEGDQGTFMVAVFEVEGPPDRTGHPPLMARRVPVHRECGVRSAMGPWSHRENGRCTCATDPEQPRTAWRQEGLNWLEALEGLYVAPSGLPGQQVEG